VIEAMAKFDAQRLIVASAAALMAGCAATATHPVSTTGPLSVRDQLPGRWDWVDAAPRCGASAAQLSFSADGQQVRVWVPTGVYLGEVALGPAAAYEIIDEAPAAMRLRLIGETRSTEAGVPVVWDLFLLDADRFCWHRTDWQVGACTKPLTRCPDG
jgi:hypothetical protein